MSIEVIETLCKKFLDALVNLELKGCWWPCECKARDSQWGLARRSNLSNQKSFLGLRLKTSNIHVSSCAIQSSEHCSDL